jgi:hypothetical protein
MNNERHNRDIGVAFLHILIQVGTQESPNVRRVKEHVLPHVQQRMNVTVSSLEYLRVMFVAFREGTVSFYADSVCRHDITGANPRCEACFTDSRWADEDVKRWHEKPCLSKGGVKIRLYGLYVNASAGPVRRFNTSVFRKP